MTIKLLQYDCHPRFKMTLRIDWEAGTYEAHDMYLTRPSLRGHFYDHNGEQESGYVEKVERGFVDGPESSHCTQKRQTMRIISA